MSVDILADEETVAELNVLVHSRIWKAFIDEATNLARAYRRALLSSKSLEEIRAAQEGLRTLKALIELPYLRSKTKVPLPLSTLWDP